MSSPSAVDVINAFVKVARNELENGRSVEIPEFGTLYVEHKESQMMEDDDGNSVMAPPRDVVSFDPDT